MTTHPLTLRQWQIAAKQQNQLRMVVLPLRPQPEHRQVYYWRGKCIHDSEYRHWCWKGHVGADNWDDISTQLGPFLPFSPGDTLWVREAFNAFQFSQDGDDAWPVDIPTPEGCKEAEELGHRYGAPQIVYRESDRAREWFKGQAWRSPVTMPRWASRYTLTAGPQTVKRLQEVTEEEAEACGIAHLFTEEECRTLVGIIGSRPEDHGWTNYLWHGRRDITRAQIDAWPHQYSSYINPIGSFSSRFEADHGPGAWDANPWCLFAQVEEKNDG